MEAGSALDLLHLLHLHLLNLVHLHLAPLHLEAAGWPPPRWTR